MTKTKFCLSIFSTTAAATLALSASPALAGATDVENIQGRSAPTPEVTAMGTDAAGTNAPGRNIAADKYGKGRYEVDLELVEGLRTGTEAHVANLMGRSAAPGQQRAHWDMQFSTIGDDPES